MAARVSLPLLSLRHQLSSIAAPAGDGLLVTSFLLEHTNTLSDTVMRVAL